MTINNNPNALPSIAIVVFRLLRKSTSPLSLQEISDLVAPISVVKRQDPSAPPKPLSDSLSLMLDFGFVQDTGDKRFELAALPEKLERDSDSDYLGRVFRSLFLKSDKNVTEDEGLWSSDRGARDFTRGICWFLMQDIWSGPRRYEGTPPSVQQEQNKQFFGKDSRKQTLFSTSIRWDAFARWAQFTGLARKDNEGLIPDPTQALSDAVSEMTFQGMVPMRVFMDDLAIRLPVIDGGSYWHDVRARMIIHDSDLSHQHVSSSLTHALRRLEDRGRIRARNEADAPDKMSFAKAYRSERVELVSHIEVIS